jgi:CheY-like chemotaxis protein
VVTLHAGHKPGTLAAAGKALNCGDTLFDHIKDFTPNLILMDVMLADMDGRAICKEIKENHLTKLLPTPSINKYSAGRTFKSDPNNASIQLAKPIDAISSHFCFLRA